MARAFRFRRLHCLRSDGEPANRSTTTHFADAVLDVERTVEDGAVRRRLAIAKSWREPAPGETVTVGLTDDLAVESDLR